MVFRADLRTFRAVFQKTLPSDPFSQVLRMGKLPSAQMPEAEGVAWPQFGWRKFLNLSPIGLQTRVILRSRIRRGCPLGRGHSHILAALPSHLTRLASSYFSPVGDSKSPPKPQDLPGR